MGSRSRKKKAAANEDYDAAAEQKCREAEFEAAIEAAASANMNPRLSVDELRRRKEQAVEAEDFQEAARLRELQRCAALEAELARMGRAKRMAAEAEDFDAAHALKSREQELHTRRDAWRRGREWQPWRQPWRMREQQSWIHRLTSSWQASSRPWKLLPLCLRSQLACPGARGPGFLDRLKPCT